MIVDLHMILLGNERQDWLDKLRNSLVGQPVNLIEIDGTQDIPHIGLNRIKGFQSGSNEWIGFVDPDDWVEPNTYNRLVEVVEQNSWVNLVSAKDQVVNYDDTPLLVPPSVGHAFITRRQCVDLESFRNRPVSGQGNIPAIRPCIYLDFIGYNYRMYGSSARQTLSRKVEKCQ